MTKSELIEKVAANAINLTHRDVAVIVDTMFASMTRALQNGERVEIRGFGSFSTKKRKSRQGRNPRTGESVQVPPKWVPAFTVGKALRERIDNAAKS